MAYLSGQDVSRGLAGCRRKKHPPDLALKLQLGQAEAHWGQLNCKVPEAAVPAQTDGRCWAQGCLDPPALKAFAAGCRFTPCRAEGRVRPLQGCKVLEN